MTKKLLPLPLLLTLVSCASDLKGEKGDQGPPGQDGSAVLAASLNRPDYYSEPVDTNAEKIIVPGSTAQPAHVAISNTLYSNSSNTVFDITLSGRGGIDSGAAQINKLYYLYAIPGTDGATFELVASLREPTVGPLGFEPWTYLGAFITDGGGTAEVIPLTSVHGNVTIVGGNSTFDLTTNATTPAPSVPSHPVTVPLGARAVYLRVSLDCLLPPDGAVGDIMEIGGNPNGPLNTINCDGSTAVFYEFLTVALVKPQTVYMRVSNSNTTATARILGWMENPAEFP